MESTVSPAMPDKMKPSFYLDHKDHPESKNHMPGDEGVMHVHYRVKSHRREDENNGSTDYEINKIEHDGEKKSKKKKNAAHMPVDELKEVIKSSQPKDDQEKQ